MNNHGTKQKNKTIVHTLVSKTNYLRFSFHFDSCFFVLVIKLVLSKQHNPFTITLFASLTLLNLNKRNLFIRSFRALKRLHKND